jgi:glucose-1-phosphate cytidylyltransferase
MKAVILAGGLGTRLSEETDRIPKPMVEIGSKPILWHIMKTYSAHGVNDFIICCGYKGYLIKEYFANYFVHTSDVTFDMKDNQMEIHQSMAEDWRVTVVDTGEQTMTGGRLRRVRKFLDPDETFCFTYGDGVGDIDITALIEFHRSHGKKATLTAVKPSARFGVINIDPNHVVTSFDEKPREGASLVNGGYFVLSPDVIDLIDGDDVSWEREPLMALASQRELAAFEHDGFWQPMDTLWEKRLLDSMWADGTAPWRVW